MFEPKGRVLLTVAVDRLAEARRTAGQTNDDARNAARVELRGEFHSGSVLATVIHPGSGETYTIFPERWALEIALTWLEQGECLLTSGLVYPRLGISFNNDPTVRIFVSEHDLQRLMAKEEVKQEAVPPPFSPIEVATPFAGKKGRGRRKGQGSFEFTGSSPFARNERTYCLGRCCVSRGSSKNAGAEGARRGVRGK